MVWANNLRDCWKDRVGGDALRYGQNPLKPSNTTRMRVNVGLTTGCANIFSPPPIRLSNHSILDVAGRNQSPCIFTMKDRMAFRRAFSRQNASAAIKGAFKLLHEHSSTGQTASGGDSIFPPYITDNVADTDIVSTQEPTSPYYSSLSSDSDYHRAADIVGQHVKEVKTLDSGDKEREPPVTAGTKEAVSTGENGLPITHEYDSSDEGESMPSSLQEHTTEEDMSPYAGAFKVNSHLNDLPSSNWGLLCNINGSSPPIREHISDRRDWDYIRAIKDESFIQLLLSNLNPNPYLPTGAVQIIGREEGSYHLVVKINVYHGSHLGQYVIKIPAIGSPSRWQQGDAYNLRCEAGIMMYIHSRTNVPVPHVIGFSDSLYNLLGAPYICMTMLPGRPAYHIWYDEAALNNEALRATNTDVPSAETMKKRRTFLETLAKHMADLAYLEFDGTGQPSFDDHGPRHPPVMAERWAWQVYSHLHPGELGTEKVFTMIPTCDTAREYFTQNLDKHWPASYTSGGNVAGHLTQAQYTGLRKLLHMIATTPAFSSSTYQGEARETFVISHTDLDLQNILTDEDGAVTGIIDWDGCMVVPRALGPASLPLFLRKDWLPQYSIGQPPHLSWSLPCWRRMYADFMVETGCRDARYTSSSALYHAAASCLRDGGDAWDLAGKVFAETAEYRHLNPFEMMHWIGTTDNLDNILAFVIERLFEPDRLE